MKGRQEEVAAQSELSPLDVRVELIYQRLAWRQRRQAAATEAKLDSKSGGSKSKSKPF